MVNNDEYLYIFLDIDGVLCNTWSHKYPNKKLGWYNDNTYPFDPKCVDVLNWLLNTKKCRIVISSDWRIDFRIDELCKIFEFYNVCGIPYDYTIVDYKNEGMIIDIRKAEIDEYISSNDIKEYLILDDLPLEYEESEKFIICRKTEGLKQLGMKFKIMKKLNML